MTHYTPTIRAALRAALETPSHTLTRVRGGFDAPQPVTVQPFTRRTINYLARQGLVEFDHPEIPTVVTLTAVGLTVARHLAAAQPRRRRA